MISCIKPNCNPQIKYKQSTVHRPITKPLDVITFSGSCIPNDISGSSFSVCRKITQKVKKLFNWPTKLDLALKRLEDEVNELKIGIINNDKKNIEEEIGDILFILSDIGQMKGIKLENALAGANTKNLERLKIMEKISPKPLNKNTLSENTELWNQAKKILKGDRDL